ncbi:hypothetical protein ACIQZG_04510 [Lysinibacillus sp. NPDC096418]|uniref:hypothetical protein n=1 Tax=Lysinibacillus sp. NPDC096418 TaxID=3364138 RepID=UPI0038113C43
MMTLPELAQALNKLYPTRFSHFISKQEPPFICYIDTDYDNVSADNEVIVEGVYIDIELYTKTKDLTAERKIKDFLNTNKLPYGQSPTIFIESEGLFQCIFSITLIN